MLSRILLLVPVLACAQRAAVAQAPDTVAILRAVATYELVTGPTPSGIKPDTWYVQDSTAFRALRDLFIERRVAAPKFTGAAPPCGGFLPWPPNDSRRAGAVLWYIINAIGADSARITAFRTCRYADRSFVTGAGYLLRRGATVWRVERQTGTIIS